MEHRPFRYFFLYYSKETRLLETRDSNLRDVRKTRLREIKIRDKEDKDNFSKFLCAFLDISIFPGQCTICDKFPSFPPFDHRSIFSIVLSRIVLSLSLSLSLRFHFLHCLRNLRKHENTKLQREFRVIILNASWLIFSLKKKCM